jgi:hypothetical protein
MKDNPEGLRGTIDSTAQEHDFPESLGLNYAESKIANPIQMVSD